MFCFRHVSLHVYIVDHTPYCILVMTRHTHPPQTSTQRDPKKDMDRPPSCDWHLAVCGSQRSVGPKRWQAPDKERSSAGRSRERVTVTGLGASGISKGI